MMKKELLMSAVGEISDSHIMEFANVKKKGKGYLLLKKALPMVACLAVIACTIPLAVNYFGFNNDETLLMSPFAINGSYYEIVTDTSVLELHGLPDEVNENMIGDYITTAQSDDGKLTAEIYDYLPYEGDSVYIALCEGDYYYLLYCNPVIDADTYSFSELLSIYGIDEAEDIGEIVIDSHSITDIEEIESLFSVLTQAEEVDTVADAQPIYIFIYGEDVIQLRYYADEGRFFDGALKYYQLTVEAIDMINNILEGD